MIIWNTSAMVNFPHMTHANELGLCRYLAARIDTQDPVIFDLGPWLGATTVIFRKANPRATIHTVDTFNWIPEYMHEPYMAYRKTCPYTYGSSFLPEFIENINWSLDSNIHIHAGNIAHLKPPEEDADIIFADVLKTPNDCSNVAINWFPRLKVGGYFLDQDFKWNPLTYGHWYVAMWRLREFFLPAYIVEGAHTVCWQKVKEIPQGMLEYAGTLKLPKTCPEMRNQTQELLSAIHHWKETVGL